MFEAEDYQALFNELGGTPADAAPAAPEATPANPENNDSVADAATPAVPENTDAANGDASEGTETPTDATANSNPSEDDTKQAKAFAEMRSTINKYQKVFKQMAPMLGVNSEDEVIERLLNAGLNAQARKQNIDPEILKRMNSLEEQNLTILNERKQKAIIESFGLLQKDFNLTNKEAMDFAKELDAKGIDIFKIGVDLSTLYRGMHHDAIVNKEVEKAKQAWIAEGKAADNAPGVTTVTGKKNNQGKTEITTMGELENLFNSLKTK